MNGIINQLFLSKQSSIERIALDKGYHNCIYQMQMLRWDEDRNSTNNKTSLSKKHSKSFRFIINFSIIMPKNI